MPDKARRYPEKLAVMPLSKPPRVMVRVPGSKSMTNRALVLAALSGRGCELRGVLQSEDTEIMVEALKALGFAVEVDWPSFRLGVGPNRSGRVIPARAADLFVGNSGTSMRFLTALVAAGQGRYRLDGVARMRERPIKDLLVSLRALGVDARSERGNGCPPVTVRAEGLRGGKVAIRGDVSSQFLSGLLMASLTARDGVTIQWHGTRVSEPYVRMTVEQMKQFGAGVGGAADGTFIVPAGQSFGLDAYAIEADASAAGYFWGAAALLQGTVTVAGLSGPSLQGDVRFVELLQRMGCRIDRDEAGLTVHGAPLRGIDADMNAVSDTVMTLAAVACFAEGPTTIRNVAHIRHKETDRLAALAAELRRVGAGVDEFAGGLTITPRPLHGAVITTYNDHRMAMSMALIGLKIPGIVIDKPKCVAKTYPGFFEDLEALRN